MEIEANLGAGEEQESLLSGLKIWAKVGVELGEQVKKQAETYWNVRSFAIGGTDVNVTATGNFGLYISGFTQSNYSPGMGALVDGGGTYGGADVMPYSENYGNDSLRVQDSENLYAVVQGGTNGQTYVANVGVLVYNVASGLGKDINVS